MLNGWRWRALAMVSWNGVFGMVVFEGPWYGLLEWCSWNGGVGGLLECSGIGARGELLLESSRSQAYNWVITGTLKPNA